MEVWGSLENNSTIMAHKSEWTTHFISRQRSCAFPLSSVTWILASIKSIPLGMNQVTKIGSSAFRFSRKSLSVTITNPANLSQYYSQSSDSSDDRPELTQLGNMTAFVR